MEKVVSWIAGSGQEISVKVELITSREINLDGHRSTVKACEINVSAYADGKLVGTGRPQAMDHAVAVSRMGKLGIRQDQHDEIMAAIAECEASDIYAAKVAKLEKNMAEISRDDISRDKIQAAMQIGEDE